ncbi:MAG: sulfate reduction electron transfer complex DsrMKJOP subunit DsrM [bacterium]
MKALWPFLVVIMLVVLVFIGVKGLNLDILFGIIIPYVAAFIFMAGVISRVVQWGRSPVPFRIPTTCGQQKSLPWIRQNKLENPSNTLEVIGRMALDVLLFRSLFRNTQTELRDGPHLAHGSKKWLWLGALAFHWSFFIILIRHLRLFVEPVPAALNLISRLDGFLQVGAPVLYLSGIVLPAAATYLLIRRILEPRIRYISLPADYFPLFLIIGIAISGILMRYFTKVEVINLKAFMIGMFHFQPVIPSGAGSLFYIHLFLVSVLLAYFPFSKLMHMGGVFFSPARNMANNNRMQRHINPWDYPVKVHTYEEYEDDFRDKMRKAGIPVEKA